MNSLKIVIPIIIVAILIGSGVYAIYKTQTALETTSDISQNSFPSPTPTVNPEVKGANAPANQPATGPEDEIGIKNIGITIFNPQKQTKITSPTTISGLANVTSQIVKISILDSNGKTLGTGQATACVGLDACSFSASIPFESPSTLTGTIEVHSPSTIDDSQIYLQSIPVSF